MQGSLQVLNTPGGFSVQQVSEEAGEMAKAGLCRIASSSKSMGLNDGDLFLALAEGRSEFDAFGIQCKVLGYMNKFLGPVVTLVIFVVSTAVFLEVLVRKAVEVGSWIKRTVGGFFPILTFMAGGAVGAGLSQVFKDESEASERASALNTGALRGIFLGLLPAPIALALNNVVLPLVDQITGPSSTSGGNVAGALRFITPSAQIPGVTVPSTSGSPSLLSSVLSNPGNPAAGLASYGVGKLISGIGRLFKKKDAGVLTEEDFEGLSAETGLDATTLMDAVFDTNEEM
jgi:hypothetical protein